MNLNENYGNEPEEIKVLIGDEDIRAAIETHKISISLAGPRHDLENFTITRPHSSHLVTNVGKGPKHVMLFACHGCAHGCRLEFAILVTEKAFKVNGTNRSSRLKSLQKFSEDILQDLHNK
jgi:hypothetical protein